MKPMILTIMFGLLNLVVGLTYEEQPNEFLVIMGCALALFGCFGAIAVKYEED